MARLRASATPSMRQSHRVLSPPSPSTSSDKENRPTPNASVPSNGGKGAMAPPPRPSMDTARHGEKRRKLGEQRRSETVTSSIERDGDATPLQTRHRDDQSRPDIEYFDPRQSGLERRDIRLRMANNLRDFKESSMTDAEEMIHTIKKQNDCMVAVRNTDEARYDSAILVSVAEALERKARQGGDASTGVDIDEFVSKCISFMRLGGPPRSNEEGADGEGSVPTPQHRRPRHPTNRDEESDDDDGNGDAYDWHIFGANACFPCNRRPPVPTFLLGPLSVQKRVRQPTQRTQRVARNANAEPATRPQELRAADLQQSENNNITTVAEKIYKGFRAVLATGTEAVEEALEQLEAHESPDDVIAAVCEENRITYAKSTDEDAEDSASAVAGVPLYLYAINPHSYGQTVENLFYLSFIINAGRVGVRADDHNMPMLYQLPEDPRELESLRQTKAHRYQAITSIEMADWEEMIRLWDIKEPLISHREEPETHTVGRGGWYG